MPGKNEEQRVTLEAALALLKQLRNQENTVYTEIMLKLQRLEDLTSQDISDEMEDVYREAVLIARATGKASTSYLQQKLVEVRRCSKAD
jgi:DNA segregation ATPase FtsK/SpoIIIE-like protein